MNTQTTPGVDHGPLSPVSELLGNPAARSALPTPSLLIEADALGRNIARMAGFARDAGLALRPHVKTHKSVAIARRQIEAGAVGICCATLDEVEVMAAAGIRGILLTSTLSTGDKLARYVAVLRQAPDTLLVVDHPQTVRALGRHLGESDPSAGVLIDVDIGYHRSGARTSSQIEDVITAVIETPGISLRGIQAYSGAVQHVAELAAREAAVREQEAMLPPLVRSLTARLGHPLIVSGGGTGTHRIEAATGILNELQAGSYVFMDADYGQVDLGSPPAEAFETALLLRASVTGVNCATDFVEPFVTIDAGTKAFALNGPPPRCVTSPWEKLGFRFMGDEHAHLLAPSATALPPLGAALEFQVSHCDPTVEHFNHYYVMRGTTLIDIWPVDARGRR